MEKVELKACPECDYYGACYVGTIDGKRAGRWPKFPLPVLVCKIGDVTKNGISLTLSDCSIKNSNGKCKDFEPKLNRRADMRKECVGVVKMFNACHDCQFSGKPDKCVECESVNLLSRIIADIEAIK